MIVALYFVPALKMNWLVVAENQEHARYIIREQAPQFEAIHIKNLSPGEGILYQVTNNFE